MRDDWVIAGCEAVNLSRYTYIAASRQQGRLTVVCAEPIDRKATERLLAGETIDAFHPTFSGSIAAAIVQALGLTPKEL